ncbi:MAG: PASTA domain-containing protein [Microthrixaceae bacterium]
MADERDVSGPSTSQGRVTEIGSWEEIDRSRHPLAAAVAIGALVALFAVGLVGLGVAIERGDRRVEVEDIAVPSIVGLSEVEALALLEDAGLILVVDESTNEVVGAGQVFEQEPIAGAKLEAGSSVTGRVSTGPSGTIVADTVGQQAAEALVLLSTVGLTGEVVPTYDEDIRPGEVLGSDPAPGRRAPPDGVVQLQVSDGPAPRTIPPIEGRRAIDVIAELGRLRLVPDDVSTDVDSELPVGNVVSISPGAGTEVPRGSRVDLVVAGTEPDTPLLMPSLVGLLRSTATDAAATAGVDVRFRTVELPIGDSRDGRVLRQGIRAGSEIPADVSVEAVVGVSPPPPTTLPPPTTAPTTTTTDASG